MSIYVNVVNQRLSIASSFDNIISGSQEFVKFKFNLGDEWNGLMTFAQFRQNGTAYNQYLDDDNCVFLPAEIGAGTCTLMLYGSGGKTIATTNYLILKIDSDILVSDAQSTEISQSLYNQLVAKIEAVTSWNSQSVTDLENKTADLQAQVNRKADTTALQTEIIRAKAAENANAAAIATKANQTQVDKLEIKITELASNEVVAQEIEKAVKAEMAEYLLSGQLAEMTIKDGSLTRAKVNSQFEETLKKADTAMQPSVYDPQGLNADIYSYAQGRADIVQENLLAVTHEIADAYKLTDTVKYSKLGDAVRGAVELSKTYTQALLADYKAFTIKIVDELPVAGESQTFYLIPKKSGDGYDKYWYITNSVGEKQWDAFGASSTVVVETLPESGETDVDYILNSPAGCLYYKWIDNAWKMVAGSLAYVAATLPSVSDGNEFTDYYITNQSNGSYIHYRLINGEYKVIGGDSYTKAEIDAFLATIKENVDTELSETSENPVQNKVITEILYDHELGTAKLYERSDLKEFDLWKEQTLEAEVSSVEFNFNTSAINVYPTELLVTLVMPPPTQSLAYVIAELECAGGSKTYFTSCGGDGSGVIIKPDTGLNFLGGFRIRLSSPFACCTTWGVLSKFLSPNGTFPKAGYGVRMLGGKTEEENHFKKLTLHASGGTSKLLPVGTKIQVYFK